MKCYNCGRADFVKEDGIYDYRASGLPYPVVLVGVPLEKCPSCGEEVVTIPDPEGLHSRLGLLIVESNRPLLHQEIRFLRKLLDKSAEDMGKLMGVDEKTLSRWENGKQRVGKVAERLLRLMVHQKLAPEAANFAEDLFPTLHETGEPAPMKVTSSTTGWSQAA